ncbi:hydroxymethylglutaryl-CoA lyase [Acuticoccus yangtzensis]|uniref:hydroxymethylglutaryl-CoA lyase n=1 Tax=Acuticoccus yangtzensis TaxID=1443441 RepID=UPI0009495937|nr:hydroxymethylglutaryl-CoA lyase [Acuticoccus yangtzensis]ORE92585.1 hydroxymethylglutaryl-CoA lyase [Stappia sp. 22II-S9-Z10]
MENVILRDVGLRDGLQLVKSIVPTEQKIEWCRRVVAAGVPEVEITSLVPAKIAPQFADAEAVTAGTLSIPGYLPSALIPNGRGAERGFDLGIPKMNYVLSASEEHNLANIRRSTQASIDDFGRIVELRNEKAPKTILAAGIATAFGCTIQGEVPEARVFEIAGELVGLGADEIIVADTVGYANPAQMKRILTGVMKEVGDIPVLLHLHDTRGLGLANMAAALEVGVRRFDASIGGLGGCPFAPGASGNINLEDAAFLAEAMGFATGIDIEALVELQHTVAGWLPDERVTGQIAQSGLPKTFATHHRQAA